MANWENKFEMRKTDGTGHTEKSQRNHNIFFSPSLWTGTKLYCAHTTESTHIPCKYHYPCLVWWHWDICRWNRGKNSLCILHIFTCPKRNQKNVHFMTPRPLAKKYSNFHIWFRGGKWLLTLACLLLSAVLQQAGILNGHITIRVPYKCWEKVMILFVPCFFVEEKKK